MSRSPGRRRLPTLAAASVLTGLALGAVPAQANPAPATPAPAASTYQVDGARTAAQRDAVARTGVAIEDAEHGALVVTGTAAEVAAVRKLGLTVTALPGPRAPSGPVTDGFPAADSGYHDYAELSAELDRVAAAYPSLVRKSSLGTSYGGRQL